MRDTTRRQAFRTWFVLACLIPTMSIVGWTLVSQMPWYKAWSRARWEQELQRRLGLAVAIDSTSRPSPGVLLLQGITLSDLETGALVGQIRSARVAWTARELAMLLSQPEIQADQLNRVWQVCRHRLLPEQAADSPHVRWTAGEVTIHGRQRAQTFRDVEGLLTASAARVQMSLSFRLAGDQMTEMADLRVARHRNHSPPLMSWEVNTRDTSIPCSIFSSHVPALLVLGERCRFRGLVEARQSVQGWDGQIAGSFTEVDLDRLVTDQFPHKLSGLAAITLNRARFAGSRLVDAAGDVLASDGVASRSLLTSAVTHLKLEPGGRLAENDSWLWRYEQLAAGFTLSDAGLQLRGKCAGQTAGIVLCDNQGPLLLESPAERVPAVSLVQTLAPASQHVVAATKESYVLLDALPLPTSRAPHDRAPFPYAPVRLRESQK